MPGKVPAVLSIDFTGVEVGARSVHVPEGDYLLQVTGCELRSKQDNESRKYLSWSAKVVEPKAHAGKPLYYRTSLVPEALWNLRGFLIALLGADKVPQRAVDIPIAKIVAAKPLFGATVQDDEYNGKLRSEIAAVYSKAEYYENQQSLTPADDEAEEAAESDEDTDEIDLDDL